MLKKELLRVFHGLSFKTTLLLLVFIVIPVCIAMFYSFSRYEGIIHSEISDRNLENMSRIESDINSVFDNMVKVSNFIVSDVNIHKGLTDPENTYFERAKIVESVINNVMDSKIFNEGIIITMVDRDGNIYSNWSLNFNDYSSIWDKEWVRQSLASSGHLVWSAFEPGYIKEDRGIKYISLARAIVNPSNYADSIATLIISIREGEIKSVFDKYLESGDAGVLVSDTKKEILIYAGDESLNAEHVLSETVHQASARRSGYLLKQINFRKYLVNTYTIDRAPWTVDSGNWNVIIFTSYDRIISSLQAFSKQMTTYLIIFVALLAAVISFLTKQIVKPIKKLDRQMAKFEVDEELWELDVKRNDEIGHLNRAFYSMAKSIKSLFNRVIEEYETKEKYKFESLRAQLNPHFLFNTLNTIRWMAIIRKADNIVDAIDALAKLLKFSMSRGSETVPLKEELENIESYIFIQNSRYGSRYKVKYNINDEFMDMIVIKFILQPIVENAIIHAFRDNEGAGLIEIEASLEQGNLVLVVRDNGRGMDEKEASAILNQEKSAKRDENKVTGLGVRNINERIKVAYGKSYGIEIFSKKEEGTTVKYTLPAVRSAYRKDDTNDQAVDC